MDVAFANTGFSPAGLNYTTRRAPACVYWDVTDAGATTPTAPVEATPAPVITPAPPPPPVLLPTPGDTTVVHALDSAAVLPDAHAQIAGGFLDLQFVEDYALMPNTVYRSHFSVGLAECLCAGARDLQLQRSLIDRLVTPPLNIVNLRKTLARGFNHRPVLRPSLPCLTGVPHL